MKLKSGISLILVVGILGTLSMLAVNLSMLSAQSRKLSGSHLDKVRSRILARSGVEHALSATGGSVSAASYETPLPSGGPTGSDEGFRYRARDTAGSLNLNDGIASGQLLLGEAYDAAETNTCSGEPLEYSNVYALGPGLMGLPGITVLGNGFSGTQEDVPDGTEVEIFLNGESQGMYVINWLEIYPGMFRPTVSGTPGGMMVGIVDVVGDSTIIPSGQINLRIRRLLNAYGDAHRYADIDNGNPGLPDIDDPNANWQKPFTFTASAHLDRLKPNPGVDGLGDVLIAARPGAGYGDATEARTLIDDWGKRHLSGTYLGGVEGSFFELIREDLTTRSGERPNYLMYHNSEDELYVNDLSPYRHTLSGDPITYRYLDEAPLDYSEMWTPVPVSLVGLRDCSRFVRTAVFYASCNVGYMVESADTLNPYALTSPKWSAADWLEGKWDRYLRPKIGVSGPKFDPALMTENGLVGADVQVNRLMSLRDAWNLSLYWDRYVTVHDVPAGFNGFGHFLGWARESGLRYERAVDTFDPSSSAGFFSHEYVERTLPHVLSPDRRLPGLLGCPLALDGTVARTTGTGSSASNTATVFKAEDLVWRLPLPKISFNRSGIIHVDCEGFVIRTPGARPLSTRIEADIRIEEERFLTAQQDFEDAQDPDPALNAEIAIGAGGVGLRDRTALIAGFSPGIDMAFDGDYDTGSPGHMPVGDNADPFSIVAMPQDIATLSNSTLESPDDAPVLGEGEKSCDLSPFGGVLLGGNGHGIMARRDDLNQLVQDSIFWRPTYGPAPLIDPAQPVGRSTGRGYVELWVRLPTDVPCVHHWSAHSSSFSPSSASHLAPRVIWFLQFFQRHDSSGSPRYCPVKIYLLTQYDEITGRQQIVARIESGPFVDPIGSGVNGYLGLGQDLVAPVNDPGIPVQGDWFGLVSPFAATSSPAEAYADWRDFSGVRVLERTAVLPDAGDHPEFGPGSWQKISVGWDCFWNGMSYPTDWAWPATDRFWLRVHDLTDSIVYESDYRESRATAGTDFSFVHGADHQYRPWVHSNNTQAILNLGEVLERNEVTGQNHLPEIGVDFAASPSRYYSSRRFNSVIDNFRLSLGQLPPSFDRFDAVGFISPTDAQQARRYDISPSNEPTWLVRVAPDRRLMSVSARVYRPRHSGDADPVGDDGPNVPNLKLDLWDDAAGAVVTPSWSSQQDPAQRFGSMMTGTGTRIRFTWENRNERGNELRFDNTGQWNAIPWLTGLRVGYRIPAPEILAWRID